jgi:hypothetical protein
MHADQTQHDARHDGERRLAAGGIPAQSAYRSGNRAAERVAGNPAALKSTRRGKLAARLGLESEKAVTMPPHMPAQ